MVGSRGRLLIHYSLFLFNLVWTRQQLLIKPVVRTTGFNSQLIVRVEIFISETSYIDEKREMSSKSFPNSNAVSGHPVNRRRKKTGIPSKCLYPSAVKLSLCQSIVPKSPRIKIMASMKPKFVKRLKPGTNCHN